MMYMEKRLKTFSGRLAFIAVMTALTTISNLINFLISVRLNEIPTTIRIRARLAGEIILIVLSRKTGKVISK